MKNFIFRNTTPCSPLKVTGHFVGTVTFILRLEEYAKEETGVKAGGKQNSEVH
jgi:hypothetical protein